MTDIEDLIREAGADAPTPRLDVPAAIRRGSALRRRRVVTRGVAIVAAAAVVCGGAALGVQAFAPGEHRTGTPAGPPSPAVSASTPSAASSAEQPDDATLEDLQRTGRNTAIEVLAQYGQPAVESEVTGKIHYTAKFSLTDTSGTTGIGVFVARGHETNRLYERLPKSCADTPDPDRCSERPNGSLLVSSQGPTYPADRDTGEVSSSVTLYRADGVIIRLTSYNGPGEKQGPSRAETGLSLEQLTDLVTDPAWGNLSVPKVPS